MNRKLLICVLLLTGCGGDVPPSPTVPEAAEETVTDSAHPWRTDSALAGRFHPDYPDDLQVIIHEGGPRLSDRQHELVWVTVTGRHGVAYEGTLLNQPEQLPTLHQGDSILFMAANEGNHPFLVTEKYLREREEWYIVPCDRCGMAELFDAPSDLQATIFPDLPAGANVEMFTSFCPICGGVQGVSSSPLDEAVPEP
jgi:hypothetical protein